MRMKCIVVYMVFLAGLILTGCTDSKSRWTREAMDDMMLGEDAFADPAIERKLPDLSDKSALGDYLVYAALNNATLEASFNRWKAALESIPQVEALPDPRFTYRYFIEEVETRVGAQRQSFDLSQTFPWFGKLKLRGDAAMAASEVVRQRFKSDKLAVFYKVKDAWYEYYYLKQAIEITKENIELIKHIEGIARVRYKAAVGGHPDVIRAQVELGKLIDRLATLTDLRTPIVAKLNAALNRRSESPLPWPAEAPDVAAVVSDEQLLALQAKHNPEVKALDFEIVRQKHRIELAKKEYFPDVTLGVTYVDTAGATGAMSPSDSGKDPVVAMVSVNLPIWRDKLDAGVRQARYRRSAAISEKQQKVNSLGAALKLATYGFRDAARKVGLYRDTLVPQAIQSLKATEASFRAGKASFTDMVDAERILLEFKLAQERALSNKAQRFAELEMLVGTKISDDGNAKQQ